MDDIDKLNLIFKADNIELGLQLVKSLGLNLKDVLAELYNRYKYIYFEEGSAVNGLWWVLNQNDFNGSNAICIKKREQNEDDMDYIVWCCNRFTGQYEQKWNISLNECFELLVNCLEKGEWNT